MSLTRDEWCRMWESIKTIEKLNTFQHFQLGVRVKRMNQEIEFIKKKIQQEIGQME
jgi:hypothetical protein